MGKLKCQDSRAQTILDWLPNATSGHSVHHTNRQGRYCPKLMVYILENLGLSFVHSAGRMVVDWYIGCGLWVNSICGSWCARSLLGLRCVRLLANHSTGLHHYYLNVFGKSPTIAMHSVTVLVKSPQWNHRLLRSSENVVFCWFQHGHDFSNGDTNVSYSYCSN